MLSSQAVSVLVPVCYPADVVITMILLVQVGAMNGER